MANQSTHNVYSGSQQAPKKGGENKKILSPSKRPQPITEIYYGHQSFTYKQFDSS